MKIAILLLGILFFLQVNHTFAQKKDSEEWNINSNLHELQYCENDSDCKPYNLKCPFGCPVPLNKNNGNIAIVLERINKFRSNCKYECLVIGSPLRCLENICIFAPLSSQHDVKIFPVNPDDFTQIINVIPEKSLTKYGTDRYIWNISDVLRVRFESLPKGKKLGDKGYYPRHHGKHYHITQRKNKNISYKEKSNIIKIKPLGYIKGAGTGFIAGEAIPDYLSIFKDKK